MLHISGTRSEKIKEYTYPDLNWSASVLKSQATTAAGFNNLLTNTFGSDLIVNNVSSGVYNTKYSTSYPLAPQYGSTTRISSKYTNPVDILKTISLPIFAVNNVIKPKSISIYAYHYNVQNTATYTAFWCLRFTGLTSGEVSYPIAFYDQDTAGASPANAFLVYGGLFSNNGKTKVQALANGNNVFNLTIDVASQCPSCFTKNDLRYKMEFVSVRTYYGASVTYTCVPLYINSLQIKY